MRIFLSSHGAGPYGAERVLLEMARHLARRGHDVTLDFPHEGPAVDLAHDIEGVRTQITRRARLPRNGTELVRFALDAAPATLRLGRVIRDGGYEIVWANTVVNPFAALAARLANVPVVWHLHERNFPGSLGRLFSRLIEHTATVPVTISDFVAESYGAKLERKLVNIGNAELRGLTPLPERSAADFVVGYLGQFETRKRVQDIVEAVARVDGVSARLVGGGKQMDAVKDRIRELGIGPRITLPGVRHDVERQYGRMDAVVFPAENEPFGLVALEAMACGRPVIAARSGALPEVLGDAALLYEAGDIDALASHIRRLHEEPETRAALVQRGYRQLERFSVERWVDQVEVIAKAAAGAEARPEPVRRAA